MKVKISMDKTASGSKPTNGNIVKTRERTANYSEEDVTWEKIKTLLK